MINRRQFSRKSRQILFFSLIFQSCMTQVFGLSTSPQESESSLGLISVTSDDLHKPIFLTTADSTGQLYVVEQKGTIRILHDGKFLPKPFLDISSMLATGGEQGLLGLAFHPDYKTNGRFFINYSRKQDGATVIAEYHRSSNTHLANTEERILLVIPQPYSNHNGGMLAFGHDGFLYTGMGDGGAGGDPEDRGQNPDVLLGKFLRIDVDHGNPYGIPSDNPFVKKGGKPEIFALGLRNPWRFSFDRETGELWAGDVGQKSWEEITIVKKGENHGWRLMEGKHCFNPKEGCEKYSRLTRPVLEYENGGGRCSVTGGYVYRGQKIPEFQGTYVFADFCSGEIFGYLNGSHRVLLDTDLQISSFGEDHSGELYVLGYSGSVHKLVSATALGGSQQ